VVRDSVLGQGVKIVEGAALLGRTVGDNEVIEE
jgi:hypothetical protein